jgi:Tol biopolymer transport system component
MNRSSNALVIGAALVVGGAALAQETTFASLDSSGDQANNHSEAPAISGDGRFVAFASLASNLVAGDTNGTWDVFVHDLLTGVTERVSVDSFGAEANGTSGWAGWGSYGLAISANGQIVAFASDASNLVAGDTNGVKDILVHDRSTGITERISVNSLGMEGNDFSIFPTLSGDGQIVAFESNASNLVAGDTNGLKDVFVHDRSTGVTERISVDSSGTEANGDSGGTVVSADGQVVAFSSGASNLVTGDTNGVSDAFVYDRSTRITERVSVDSSGAEGNGPTFGPSISGDGQIVAFWSYASNLVASDTNGWADVFVHGRSTGVTQRVSVDSAGTEGDNESGYPSISADGNTVVFQGTASNLVAGDQNGFPDVFVHDMSSGVTARVNVDSTGAEAELGYGYPGVVSSDGLTVAFASDARNLVAGDTNDSDDVFVHIRCMIEATWSNYGTGFPGTGGVPTFTAQSNPVIGTSLTLNLANSYGKFTFGLLFIGYQQATIHSALGGDLLLVPAIATTIGLPPSGTSFTGAIPYDEHLGGFEIDLQAIESDPGATKGVSFTPGLELTLGH